MGYRWTWILAAVIVVSLAIFAGWFLIGGEGEQDTVDRQRPLRPATINNVLLRIESNISRIQSTMEDLVFSKYPANLAEDVKVGEPDGGRRSTRIFRRWEPCCPPTTPSIARP